jgi:hypothetical protein
MRKLSRKMLRKNNYYTKESSGGRHRERELARKDKSELQVGHCRLSNSGQEEGSAGGSCSHHKWGIHI